MAGTYLSTAQDIPEFQYPRDWGVVWTIKNEIHSEESLKDQQV